jgi:kinesin family member C2/C3
LSFGGKKKRNADARDPSSSQSLLSSDAQSSSFTAADIDIKESGSGVLETLPAEQVQKLSAEFSAVKLQFELLKRTTVDELNSLPESSKAWAAQVSQALATSEAEVSRLRSKLALECSTRRKLLHEVQDLRGAVRVYCRPRPVQNQNQDGANTKPDSILSAPSREILLLHREKLPGVQEQPPMAFEFDRIFDPQMDQADVYGELEELVLNILDGYNVCMLAFGQTGSGKTHSLIGDIIYKLDESFETAPVVDIENYGIHLLGAKQLFNVAEHRSERYQDMFFLTLVEVNDERLCDLIAGTEIGSSLGRVEGDNSIIRNKKETRIFQHNRGNSDEIGTSTHGSNKLNKLEIRTSEDGETVVQGLVSVPISRIEDVCEVWRQALSLRADRLQELNANICDYDAGSHVIATIKVVSTNIATGIGTMGKIQFVDLAGADLDLVTRRPPSGTKSKLASTSDGLLAGVGNSCEWKYTHKSLATFSDVVSARSQFMRSVPYRNSTLTHLLRDSLEADTKVMMLVTVSSDPKHAQETACALRLASRIRRVNIGKATKHSVSQV